MIDELNARGAPYLPGHLGIRIQRIEGCDVFGELDVATHLLAPNGFLHAGSVISLADTACGYGCIANLPEGARSFTTIEIKSNHLGTARAGTISVHATAVHLGRTTQVWDATVTHGGKAIALFRCTQMLIYPS